MELEYVCFQTERESECVYACERLFCHFAGVKVSKCKRIVKKVCALFLFMYIKLLHFNFVIFLLI